MSEGLCLSFHFLSSPQTSMVIYLCFIYFYSWLLIIMLAFLDTLDLIYAVQADEKRICASSPCKKHFGEVRARFLMEEMCFC